MASIKQQKVKEILSCGKDPKYFLRNYQRINIGEFEIMQKTIIKSLRFTQEEFSKIELELKRSNLSFSNFARGILLKQKIKLPITIELIYELNLIQTQLNEISLNMSNKDRLKNLKLLVLIEKKLEELI